MSKSQDSSLQKHEGSRSRSNTNMIRTRRTRCQEETRALDLWLGWGAGSKPKVDSPQLSLM